MRTRFKLNIYHVIMIPIVVLFLKGRSRRLRPKAHILDDHLGNPYDGLKVLLGPPYGPYKGPLWPYNTPTKVALPVIRVGQVVI